ncbi:hypothetical protein L3Y34_009935 [Caenorhabditis briggsae]|uniref:Uncharacterized protein n=1 Tax=Caenorhabditis briggsae TaxID=6238 RepID=A0AAE9A6K1_CAEBR|nr:hypothetical protein L3Y34_009935 [Caenorhabditis briggsae]
MAWLSVLGGNFGFTILTLYGPTYLKNVLHFDVKETGFATALPFILSALVKFAAGRISDKMEHLSEKHYYCPSNILSISGGLYQLHRDPIQLLLPYLLCRRIPIQRLLLSSIL